VFHVKHEGWPSPLSTEAIDLLERYARILLEEALPRGWIARTDVSVVRERHVLDGLRGLAGIPAGARRAVDLGSGAGIPGIPIAIALPELEVVLAESRRTRAAFLERVVAELGLPRVSVAAGRAEDLAGGFDVAMARGFAPPGGTWAVAERLLAPGGRLLYWAGASFDLDTDVPPGAAGAALREPGLESEGSIVIMTRQ
jgi:16S rRNA (guanine527-N7)-methyltransferase